MLTRRKYSWRIAFCLMVCCLGSYRALADSKANDLLRRADRLGDLFNWSDAGPLYRRAETQFLIQGDSRNALHAKLGRIRASMETLDLSQTSDTLGHELRSDLLRNDLRLRLFCFTVKGDIDGEIDSDPAFADWNEALTIAKQLGDAKWTSRAEAELGFQKFLRGDSTGAMRSVARALLFARKAKDIGAQIRYLGAIGTGLALRQANEQALNYLDQAIQLARNTPDAGYPFLPIAGKIQALINKKQFADAKALISEAERVAERQHKNIKLAQLFLFEADIAAAEHQWPRAIQSLRMAETLPGARKSRLFAECQMKLADVYRQTGDLRLAALAARTTVAQTGNSRDLYLAPARLRTLAAVEVALGRKQVASRLLQRARDIIEGFVSRAPDLPVRSAILAEASPIFADHFALAVERGRTEEAFEAVEQVRGRIVTEALFHPVVLPVTDIPTEDRIRRLKIALVRAGTQNERQVLAQRLFFAEQARWTKLPAKAAPVFSAPEPRPGLWEIQRRLTGDQVILEYVLSEEQAFCLVIRRDRAAIIQLGDRHIIDSLAATFLSELAESHSTERSQQALYTSVIQPLHLTAADTSLLIVPDGVLNRIPFAALRDAKNELLIQKHVLCYLPSAGSMALKHKPPSLSSSQLLLAFGGIDYEGKSRPPLVSQSRSTLRRGSEADEFDISGMTNLPGTEEEVRTIAGILGESETVLKTGRDGTKTEFETAVREPFRIIHLAVHGRANEKNLERSVLIFRPNPPTDDGLLEPRDILGLRLNTDLVVLSACETAVGQLQGEEGIANLARVFLMAGARSVVSTLWKIDDNYALFLMKRFYIQLRQGKSVATALALSQRELLAKFGPETPVSDWAAFTVLGDGKITINSETRAEEKRR